MPEAQISALKWFKREKKRVWELHWYDQDTINEAKKLLKKKSIQTHSYI